MKILFIAKPLSKKGNGVVSALKNEILYLQKYTQVALYNIGVELESDIAQTVFSDTDYPTISSLPQPFDKPDIVVFEEVYKLEYYKLYNECLKNKLPYVIIPHGCLVEVEQRKKKWKHIIANMLIFNRYIKKATAVQYLNEQEKNASHFKCRQTIIIPNSIEFKQRRFERNCTTFQFIYIGRYDIITKGLDLMIEAFAEMKDWCRQNNVTLELYGPTEEDSDFKAINELITNLKCQDIIKANGPVYGEEKEKKLQEASIFIQTSRNEGQPMSIIEALSYGLPCVVTYETSFGTYCEDNHCGIGVHFSKSELSKAVKEIFANKEYFSACQKNAIECMKRDFEIQKVAEQTLKKYKSL